MDLTPPPGIRALQNFPRLVLGHWPTPVQACLWHGRQVWVKRDDLSGFGRGGAKTRKIECVLGWMQSRRLDTLVTVMGNITNLGFDLVPAFARSGLAGELLIANDPPLLMPRRQAIFQNIGQKITFLSASRCQALGCGLFKGAILRLQGKRPFLLLPGASHPAGVVGNALGLLELTKQADAGQLPYPARIWITLATGTTPAGLLLAAWALEEAGHPPIDIHAVQVYPGAAAWRTRGMLAWTRRALGGQIKPGRSKLIVDTAHLRGGFGRHDAALTALVRDVASATDLTLDPIFGGKTWEAMAAHSGGPGADLYWHCGHTPEWAAFSDLGR